MEKHEHLSNVVVEKKAFLYQPRLISIEKLKKYLDVQEIEEEIWYLEYEQRQKCGYILYKGQELVKEEFDIPSELIV